MLQLTVERDDQQQPLWRFVLQPNQSLSWRGSQFFFLSLCMISAAVAVPLAWMGFWLILPFAGLELCALWLVLYLVARRSQQREIIYITADSIRIEKGKHHVEQQWTLMRLWARVVLEQCPKQWYPSRLIIRSHGRAVEVGRFLNEDERQHLASELNRCL